MWTDKCRIDKIKGHYYHFLDSSKIMDMDKFLKSQTFKTGAFVLLVIFVLLFVFKLGVLYGYKKTNFSHGYGINHHRTFGSPMFRNHGGTLNKEMFGKIILKRQLIKDKALSDSATEDESGSEEIVE